MALGSVLRTALSGISAAETAVAVVANNLANSRTDGFKASKVVLASQRPVTRSPGNVPTAANGGTNPVQVGTGVQVAAVTADHSQGSIVLTANPTELALEGDGFFIVEGDNGERLFTRNGNFRLNADRQLVTADGRRVLGHAVDENFQVQETGLVPVTIPLNKQAADANGNAATLTSFSIGSDGRINGHFSDGRSRDLGQIQVARFANPSGLSSRTASLFASGPNSGLAVVSRPGQSGAATITAGARELSNTNVGRSLIDLVLASTQFRASAAVFNTADQLLDELMNLRR